MVSFKNESPDAGKMIVLYECSVLAPEDRPFHRTYLVRLERDGEFEFFRYLDGCFCRPKSSCDDAFWSYTPEVMAQ